MHIKIQYGVGNISKVLFMMDLHPLFSVLLNARTIVQTPFSHKKKRTENMIPTHTNVPVKRNKIGKIEASQDKKVIGNQETIEETANLQNLNLTHHQKKDIKSILIRVHLLICFEESYEYLE